MMFDPSQTISFSEQFVIDKETLRDVPRFPGHLRSRIAYLMTEMLNDTETEERIRHLGELGSLHRVLGESEIAEQYLGEALSLVQEDELPPRWFVTYGVRLAHVWQWQERFEESNPMFEELLLICSEHQECEDLLDFVYQHHGKNLFDQARYQEALEFFEKARAIRHAKGESELTESTELAMMVTRSKI